MASPAQTRSDPAPMSLEEFLRLPERKPSLEYVDGRVEAKVSPQIRHARIAAQLLATLNDFARPAGLGEAFPELRCTYAGRSVVPDVVFLLREHIPVDDAGEYADEVRTPPDLHVEILSPRQSVRATREKLAHATSHGCPLGWFIDPMARAVDVYRPGRTPERLAAEGVLEGDPVLPGFRLGLAELFGWLRPDW